MSDDTIEDLYNDMQDKDKRIAELECQYTEAVDAMQDRLNVRERVIAELEADNKRLEKENNLLRDTVEPRTEQLIAMAAKNKALRKACIRLIWR